jgi:hypothetical protein
MSFYLNQATGDLDFDHHNNVMMIEGEDEKVQAVRLLLGTRAGEWFLNTLHGFAYDKIQVKAPGDELIRAEVLKCLRQEPRISEVMDLQISLDRVHRHLEISFKLRMDGEEVGGELTI